MAWRGRVWRGDPEKRAPLRGGDSETRTSWKEGAPTIRRRGSQMGGTMSALGTKCWSQMNRNNKGRLTRAIWWLHLLPSPLTGVTQSRSEGPASQNVPVQTPSFAKSPRNGPHSPGLRGTTCVLWPQGRQSVPARTVASFIASSSPSSRVAFAASGTFISLFGFFSNLASKQKTHVAVPLSPCGWCCFLPHPFWVRCCVRPFLRVVVPFSLLLHVK